MMTFPLISIGLVGRNEHQHTRLGRLDQQQTKKEDATAFIFFFFR